MRKYYWTEAWPQYLIIVVRNEVYTFEGTYGPLRRSNYNLKTDGWRLTELTVGDLLSRCKFPITEHSKVFIRHFLEQEADK